MPRTLNILLVVGDTSTEEDLFFPGDHKGGIGQTDSLPDWSKPDVVQLLEGSGMQFPLKPQLPMLVASLHEQITVGIDGCYVIVPA